MLLLSVLPFLFATLVSVNSDFVWTLDGNGDYCFSSNYHDEIEGRGLTLEKCKVYCEKNDECSSIVWNDIEMICELLECKLWAPDSSRPTLQSWVLQSACNEDGDCKNDSFGPYCLNGSCGECSEDRHCYDPDYPDISRLMACQDGNCVEKEEK